MTTRTSRQVIEQAISDFDDIREAIRGHRVRVEYPTKTSAYAGLIANIRIGSVSGTAVHTCTPPLMPVSGKKEKQSWGAFPCVIYGSFETVSENE